VPSPTFTVGQQCRIIGNTSGHYFNVGDVVTLIARYENLFGEMWDCKWSSGTWQVKQWIVAPVDLELLSDSSIPDSI
jgi:hypothetical protein